MVDGGAKGERQKGVCDGWRGEGLMDMRWELGAGAGSWQLATGVGWQLVAYCLLIEVPGCLYAQQKIQRYLRCSSKCDWLAAPG